MIFATAASVVPHIRSGKVRALAVTPIRARPCSPSSPPWTSSASRASTPPLGTGWWRRRRRRARSSCGCIAPPWRRCKDAQVRKSLAELGVDIVGNTPEEFAAYIKAEIPKWTAIVKASGAKLD